MPYYFMLVFMCCEFMQKHKFKFTIIPFYPLFYSTNVLLNALMILLKNGALSICIILLYIQNNGFCTLHFFLFMFKMSFV